MTLDALLTQRLAEWRFSDERSTLTVVSPESGWTVDLTADCADAVGCRLWEVALRPTTPHAGLDLKTRAVRLAGRAIGLLEPLKVIEVDTLRSTAQLRSEQPGQHAGRQHYYEVLLEGNGAASVRRFQTPHDGAPRREQEAFTLTHEALVKLIGDLAAV